MVFKARFFSSSKKSDSSSTDGSNSPRTPAAASSPFRSSSKRIQSSSRWKSGKDVVPMHQLLQQLKDSPPSAGHVASPPDAAASGSLSPIGASSLGLNRIKTRSGPLPQEWFKDHRIPGLGAGNRSRASLSSVSALMSASALKRSSKKVPEPHQAVSSGARGVSERPDSRLCGPDQSSLQMEKIITERNRSEDMENYDACNSDAKTPYDFCETPKESESPESPRFKARMQATNVPRRRSPTDIKSFSHELNSKGVCPFPFWKPRNTYNLKEVLKVIQVKFEKAKEEVNSDLVIFAGDLLGVMEKNAENHPEWMETLEDLLLLARKCSFMEPGQFWMHCEGIVQHLDDQRQELPMGALKKLYTHMLFILTRCTRLVQFHKESGFTEGEFIMDHQDSRFIRSVEKDNLLSERDGRKEAIVSRKSYSQEKHNLNRKKPQEIIKPQNSFTSVDVPAMKSRGEASQIKDEPFNRKMDSSRILNKGDNYDRDLVMNRLPELPSSGDSSVHPGIPSKHQYKVSWGGHWADQKNISQDGSIMCRICEEYVPTLFMEDHSKICAIANRCDQKGLSVDDRLIIIAETLERFVESFSQKDLPNVAGTSDLCVTQDTGILSPKLSDWSRRGSADMLDCYQEPDKSIFQDDLKNFPTMICNTRFGPKSDQGKSSSSASITPRSPLMTPRTTHIDMLLAGWTALSENDDIPQIAELADIARCIAKTSLYDEQSLSNLVSSVQALQGVINRQKLDALTVQTFGARIEKLHREKYLQLCDTVDVEKVDLASTAMEEEEDVVRSLRTSPVHPTSKDRISIDDFEIIKPISRGAFGRVFLAKKRTTGDIFAIKVLKKADMIRKNAVESILAERDILISVRNPFVVRFFYSFTSRENLYLVMEYLNGGDLYSLLRNLGCLDEEVTRIYIAEVVLALEYLHSLCVVHRDLKPDNLLIAHDGHIKLTDFGLSKVGLINSTDDLSGPAVSDTKLLVEDEPQIHISEHSHQHERQKERSAVGTPDYLAPEILLGTRHGASADWWSVGVILFELIVGIPPFNAEHPQTIFDNILNRKIPWPKVPEEMSFDARDLIDKLLTEDPTERLGAKGASEVKEHSFFKDINWDTLARQKAAFIPSSGGVFDTSYFTCRYTWNSLEEQNYEASEFEDSTDDDSISGNSSSISHHDEPEDEFEGLAGFEPGSSVNYSFSNFSYKNLSQLALINYDLLSKGWNEELPTMCDP